MIAQLFLSLLSLSLSQSTLSFFFYYIYIVSMFILLAFKVITTTLSAQRRRCRERWAFLFRRLDQMNGTRQPISDTSPDEADDTVDLFLSFFLPSYQQPSTSFYFLFKKDGLRYRHIVP